MSSGASAVHVDLGDRGYDIRIGSGCLAELGSFVRPLAGGELAVVVTDTHVDRLFGGAVVEGLRSAGYRCERIVLEPGEQTKSLAQVEASYDRLIDFGADRRTLIVALGGGGIGDLAGVVAGAYPGGAPLPEAP